MITKFQDSFILHNGVSIPCVGYGTYKSLAETARDGVAAAIELGYRHIDTAAFYKNEEGVAEGIQKSGVAREELFLTTKVWNTDRGYDKAIASFEGSLKALNTSYVDLLLIHWPANRKQFGDEAKAINADTWKAFEDLYRAGKVKAIGLSNFWIHHIEELMETAEIKPMVDQIEFHPGWANLEVAEFCQKNGILVEAWSPLGRSAALGDPVIGAIAQKYGKTPAQIILRWILQHEILPLPKSATTSRIAENREFFDFELSAEDMLVLDQLEVDGGSRSNPDEVDF